MHMDKALRDFTVRFCHVETAYFALITMPLKGGLASLAVTFVTVDGYLNGGSFDVGGFLLDLVREEVWFDGFVFMGNLKALLGEQPDAL